MHPSASISRSSASSSLVARPSSSNLLKSRRQRRRQTATTTTTTRAIFGLFEKKKEDQDDDGFLSSDVDSRAKQTPAISQTLQSLDDLLGEDPKILAEKRADERAKAQFEMQEKKKQLKEETKKMYSKRFERFQLAVKQSTSIQRLQAVFLEGFLLPTTTNGKNEEGRAREKIEFFDLPSEIIDPRTGDRLKANAKATSSSDSSSGSNSSSSSSNSNEGGSSTTTTIDNSAVNRLPGEFQIPIIPYGHVVVPGARAKLNLFEPRWLTLFSKLLKPEDAEEDRTILTSHQWGGTRDAKTIDFSKIEMIADYESGERRFDIVPGANR